MFCRKNIAKLNKELQTKTLLQLSETDRLRHTEHQLHISESKVEKLNSENIKLRLKIDDLRIKMQNCKYYSEYTVLVYRALTDPKKKTFHNSLLLGFHRSGKWSRKKILQGRENVREFVLNQGKLMPLKTGRNV